MQQDTPYDRRLHRREQWKYKKEILCPCHVWIIDIQPCAKEALCLRERILGLYFAFEAFRHILFGNEHPILVLTDNKSLNAVLPIKTSHTKSLERHRFYPTIYLHYWLVTR